MNIELTFTEPLLGTWAGDPKLASEFIAARNPNGPAADEQEVIEGLDEQLHKASTVFARDEQGRAFIWDYQVKGFFKEACQAMIGTGAFAKEELKKVSLTSYLRKRTIDQQLFVTPRRIPLILPDGIKKLEFCERPLRAETMRGERIALARSEMAPAGTRAVIDIIVMNPKLGDFVTKWLDYGRLTGMGQWRNSGMGRFEWKVIATAATA